MNKLFKEMWQSYYGQWVLCALGGLVSVCVFPSSSLGWICLNIIIFCFVDTLSLVLHELGHAIAALCVGLEVNKIVIGHGKNVLEFQIFGIPLKIKQVPTGGVTHVLCKSTYFYRSRFFIVSLFGPLTNLMLVLLILKFPKEFITFNPPNIYVFPGIIICLVNAIFIIRNLFPCNIIIDGVLIPSDGLQMRTLSFLSTVDIATKVAESWLADGYNLEQSGNYQKAIAICPGNKSFYSARASVYCCSGIETQAVKDFTRIIEIEADGDAYYNRGAIYYQLENYQATIEDLDISINLDGNSISPYYIRGNAKYQLEDKVGASEDYDRAEFLTSIGAAIYEDEYGFHARGIAHLRRGTTVKAIKDFHTAESLCLEHGNTSLLQQIRQELQKISTY